MSTSAIQRTGAVAAVTAGAMLAWSGLAPAMAAPEGFSEIIKLASPAVVTITTEQRRPDRQMPGPRFSRPDGMPAERFFREFAERFDDTPTPSRGQGTGFVIDADGYIVTNNHVVDKAGDITVTLGTGTRYTARVVGVDAQTDLALLKVEADQDLPTVAFGDSDAVEVGDWVIAVGNPFGLGGTVTAGIVSARGRDINAGPFDDFLQVDAPLNRGNSGGPLLDTDGAVIGVNTAIVSPSGGNVGIGFAIPSNLAKDVIQQLRDDGSVERGWLGVQIQTVTPEIAAAIGLEEAGCALVANVTPDSPAAMAEMQRGDVIQSFAGTEIGNVRDLTRTVAATQAGTTVDLTVWRDRARQVLNVTVGAPQRDGRRAALQNDDRPAPAALGARLAPLSADVRRGYGIDDSVDGVLVAAVDAGGVAFKNGLRAGDVIVEIGGRTVISPRDAAARIDDARAAHENSVLVLIDRRGTSHYLGLPVV